MSNKKNETVPKKKMNFALKIFLIFIVSILVIVIVSVATGYFYLKNKLGKINYVAINPSSITVNNGVDKALSNYRNIVLLGIDAREDTFSRGNRSDCIMIISINEKTNNVKIMSVYRDTYLNIDGHGLDKVTHAYSYGGPELALSTLNKNLDLNITEFVTVNFETVKTVVNAVDGIEMLIDEDEVKFINGISSPGRYKLDGDQALAYSRIRKAEGGDYKRTERMRDVLNAVFNKVKTLGVSKVNSLANEILPHISTNISEDEIIKYIPKLASVNVTKDFGWPYNVRGYQTKAWYGVPVTLEDSVSKFHEELFGQNNYQPTETVKSISNEIIEKTGYTK